VAKDSDHLLAEYRVMLVIRRVEERLSALFAAGEIPGFIHLSIGQEAVAAGIMSALEATDTIASTHRGHGHSIAKGVPLDRFFMELLGKREGLCAGHGGSIHVADLSVGMLGANGIVGAGIPLALGSALAHKLHGGKRVAAAFFGDGALAEGTLHESLNMAALWRLPMLFVLENNGWAEFSKGAAQFAGSLSGLAGAFGIAYRKVDGNDVREVAAAAAEEVAALRDGKGPRAIECVTRRVHGHFEGDPQKYRAQDEQATVDDPDDPLVRARQYLLDLSVGAEVIEQVGAEVEAAIELALGRAREGSEPRLSEALDAVYTSMPEAAR